MVPAPWKKPLRAALVPVVCVMIGAVSGCSTVMSAATESLANSVSDGILNSEDPETVRDGAPAYLLLIDGLLQNDPDNKGLLRAAATLNSAYASGFVEDVERRRRMASRALQFAIRAMCRIDRRMCEPRTVTYEDFSILLAGLELKHVPGVYSLGTAWLGWIQANAEDFNAIADVARVKGIMMRVVELDESYDFGGPHLYLGALETFLPPAMGGRPEIGRRHTRGMVRHIGWKRAEIWIPPVFCVGEPGTLSPVELLWCPSATCALTTSSPIA